MHATPPREIRTPPPRFRGDPGISRPDFCGPHSPICRWARSGPRRPTTIWRTWTPNLSPPIGSNHLVAQPPHGLRRQVQQLPRSPDVVRQRRRGQGVVEEQLDRRVDPALFPEGLLVFPQLFADGLEQALQPADLADRELVPA